MRSVILLLLSLLAYLNPLMAQDDAREIEALDQYIESSRKAWRVPGLAVAIVKEGKVLLAKGYGEKKLGSGEAVNEQTLFNIGSTTKAFTAVAMGMLVDEGKVDWDDRVVDHMPELQLADAHVTQSMRVRDLFTHNLGLPNADFLWAATSDFGPEEILRRMRYLPMAYPLRGGYTYQNIMYLAAGALIERLSGLTWEKFIQTRVFQPLGMKDSYPTLALSQVERNRSTPHSYGADWEMVPVQDISADAIAPAGAIWSSISDMAK